MLAKEPFYALNIDWKTDKSRKRIAFKKTKPPLIMQMITKKAKSKLILHINTLSLDNNKA